MQEIPWLADSITSFSRTLLHGVTYIGKILNRGKIAFSVTVHCCCSCRWGENYVSELRPPMGLLFIPHMMYENGVPQWNNIDGGNRRTRRKTCPSTTSSNANPTWTDPGANPGFHVKRLAIKHLSHGTAQSSMLQLYAECYSTPTTIIKLKICMCCSPQCTQNAHI
jgi:hypothetical protein